MATTMMVSALKQLNELEERAIEKQYRLETCAEDAGAQAPIVALAAVLDRARQYEQSARAYGTPYTDAENLRASVVYLADLIDKDVERRSS
jgi:hypothetical protein